MRAITESQVSDLLKKSDDEKVRDLSRDAGLVKALAKVFTTTLEIAPDAFTSGMANKSLAISSLTEVNSNSSGLWSANFVANQAMMTIGLAKAAGYSPARAATFISIAVAEKIVAAAGLAEMNKCKVALASLAVTTGLTVVSSPTGIGIFVGVVAVAADAFDAYGKCSSAPPVQRRS